MLRKMMLTSSTPLLIGAEEFVITPGYADFLSSLIGYQNVLGKIGNLVPEKYQGDIVLDLSSGGETIGNLGTSLLLSTTKSYSKFFIQRMDTLTTLRLDFSGKEGNLVGFLNSQDLFSEDDVGKEIHLLIRGE